MPQSGSSAEKFARQHRVRSRRSELGGARPRHQSRRLTKPCCTSSSSPVDEPFSPARRRIGRCRRCGSIPLRCPPASAPNCRWPDRDAVMRRCAVCRRKKLAASSTRRRSFACSAKRGGCNGWPNCTATMKRSIRKSPRPSATNKTNCPFTLWRNGFRSKLCAPSHARSRRFSLASADFSRHQISPLSRLAHVSICARFGTGWWPRRAALERLILPSRTWRLSGTRPLNHPQRRLAALAGIVAAWPQFSRSLGKTIPLRRGNSFSVSPIPIGTSITR